jgi:DNA-binding CsgD family transcriptional regulator
MRAIDGVIIHNWRMVRPRTSIGIFAFIALLMAVDAVIDYRQSGSFFAQTFEMLVFVSALAGIAVHGWQLASARSRSERLDRELAETRADAQRWSREAQDVLNGLGAAIDRQFDKWGLTPAERDVALLQLKGLRHRQIAELRETSERTVRQQALAVYRKAGLTGRTDLAAFFLEDLLLPSVRHPTDGSPADAG